MFNKRATRVYGKQVRSDFQAESKFDDAIFSSNRIFSSSGSADTSATPGNNSKPCPRGKKTGKENNADNCGKPIKVNTTDHGWKPGGEKKREYAKSSYSLRKKPTNPPIYMEHDSSGLFDHNPTSNRGRKRNGSSECDVLFAEPKQQSKESDSSGFFTENLKTQCKAGPRMSIAFTGGECVRRRTTLGGVRLRRARKLAGKKDSEITKVLTPTTDFDEIEKHALNISDQEHSRLTTAVSTGSSKLKPSQKQKMAMMVVPSDPVSSSTPADHRMQLRARMATTRQLHASNGDVSQSTIGADDSKMQLGDISELSSALQDSNHEQLTKFPDLSAMSPTNSFNSEEDNQDESSVSKEVDEATSRMVLSVSADLHSMSLDGELHVCGGDSSSDEVVPHVGRTHFLRSRAKLSAASVLPSRSSKPKAVKKLSVNRSKITSRKHPAVTVEDSWQSTDSEMSMEEDEISSNSEEDYIPNSQDSVVSSIDFEGFDDEVDSQFALRNHSQTIADLLNSTNPVDMSVFNTSDSLFDGTEYMELLTPRRSKTTGLVQSPKRKVLALCGQEEPCTFEDCINPDKCVKIGEGVYGEVFKATIHRRSVALKIIPIEGNQCVNDEPQKTFEEMLPEIVIASELSQLSTQTYNKTCSFVQVNSVSLVQGAYPDGLLHQWDVFHAKKVSENDRPDIFDEDQLFIVFEFEEAGCALESFKFADMLQARSVLAQVTSALAVAETALEFEHRDLHWGNVLVKPTREKVIHYQLEGQDREIETHGVKIAIIDFTLSRLKKDNCVYTDLSSDPDLFKGHGDYQFDVYRLMQEENGNEWKSFCPRTNVFWIHYLTDKLIKSTVYAKTDPILSRHMRALLREMLDYQSAVHLLCSSEYLLEQE